MTDEVKEAIEVLRNLPDEKQHIAARAILDFAAEDDRWQLTDEQVAEVERRRANPKRKFLSVAEARKRLRHLGA
jgi:hypothetical protein